MWPQSTAARDRGILNLVDTPSLTSKYASLEVPVSFKVHVFSHQMAESLTNFASADAPSFSSLSFSKRFRVIASGTAAARG
jgi:hypothetical protein